jgi:hypothetical protein
VLIHIAISEDANLIKKEAQQVMICQELTLEIQRMWNVKAKVVPVKTGATGTISKSLRPYLSNTPGKHEIKELQKTPILSTAHTLREVLMQKYKTYFTGEITLHVAQTVDTE